MLRRYQRGAVYLYKGKKVKTWYGMFREDLRRPDGSLVRRQRRVRLGTLQELPTRAEAQDALSRYVAVPSQPTMQMNFSELAARWEQVVVPTLKPTTADYYLKVLHGPVSQNFESREISTISKYDVEVFLTSQASRYSRNSLRGMRTTLSQVFTWAISCNWLEKNPSAGVKLPRACAGRHVQRRVLATDEVVALSRKLEEPYASLVLFLYVTGLRIGEAVAIKWSDFDGEVLHVSRRLYEGEVDTLKTVHSERGLPVPAELVSRLRKLGQQGWVFKARNGSPVNPKNVLRRYVRPAAKALGIQLGGWHDLRHSCTTQLRRAGAHPKVISGILGHSGVELAMKVYDHAESEDFREPLNQLLQDVMKSEASARSAR